MRTPTSSFTSLESTKYRQEAKRLKKKVPGPSFLVSIMKIPRTPPYGVELASGPYASPFAWHPASPGVQLGDHLCSVLRKVQRGQVHGKQTSSTPCSSELFLGSQFSSNRA